MKPVQRDATLLPFKAGGGGINQGIWAASKSQRSQENKFSPRASRKAMHLDFSPGKLVRLLT